MRTTRQTVLEAMRWLVAAVLVASGLAVIFALGPVPGMLAEAGISLLAARIVAAFMIANGALIVVPRFAFFGTLVPLALAFFWIVVALRAGELVISIAAITAAVALAWIAYATKPKGLPPTPGEAPA